MNKIKTINFEEWVSEYKPIQNPFTKDESYDNMGFETYREQLEYVVNHFNNVNKKQVWTLLSCENEESWIVPGYLYVDRMLYFITEKEWESEDIQVNDNEMIDNIEAKVKAVEILNELRIEASINELSDFFTKNYDKIFNNEMTIGRAKYILFNFIEEILELEITDEQQDFIHNKFND